MLIGAPVFKDARRAFLRFSQGAVLVEHSHDAFDTWLVGRGLESPLEHPIIDTTALARLVLDLPKGQTPGLARLVDELGLDVTPAHAALDDARATAMVFRALIERAREKLGWRSVGDVVAALPRPVIDRTPPSRRGSSAGPAHLAAHEPEVRELQLHVDRPRAHAVGLQPFGDSVGEVAKRALELGPVADIVLERRLRRDRLGGPAAVDRRSVAALGESLQDGAIRAERLDQALRLIGGQRAHGAQAHRMQPLFGLRAEPRNDTNGQRRKEIRLRA